MDELGHANLSSESPKAALCVTSLIYLKRLAPNKTILIQFFGYFCDGNFNRISAPINILSKQISSLFSKVKVLFQSRFSNHFTVFGSIQLRGM